MSVTQATHVRWDDMPRESLKEGLLRAGVCQAGLTPGAIGQASRRAVAMARMEGTGRPRPERGAEWRLPLRWTRSFP